MLKKLFVTAAAVAAVSVPLAGAAWADPGDPNGNGLGQGGMPQRLSDFAASGVDPVLQNPLGPPGTPIPPGQEFNLAKDLFKGPGESTPDAIAQFESFVWTNPPGRPPRTLVGVPGSIPSSVDDWTNITPGLAITPFTHGCGKGRTGLPAGIPASYIP